MATSFIDIYNLNEVIKDDNRLLGKPTNQIYNLYYKYLEFAISYFIYDCYKDLSLMTPFSQEEYYYVSDGSDNEYLLSSTPTEGCEFYVGYREDSESNYTQIFDFDYDGGNIITVNEDIPVDNEVYISAYIIGEFTDTLNFVEKTILANGMNVPWSQQQEFKNSLLNQMVYGGTTKIYSQGEHIKQVKGVSSNQYFNVVKGMINEYSYKGASSIDGLGGGLV